MGGEFEWYIYCIVGDFIFGQVRDTKLSES